MRVLRFALFIVFSFSVQSFLHAVQAPSVLENVLTFRPEDASAEYFKKAHSALVYDPTKIIDQHGITRYEQADPALFFTGLWWAVVSGFFLMFTSLGLFVFVMLLALLYQYRFKDVFPMLQLGSAFVGSFTVLCVGLNYFSFQVGKIFEIPWLHLIFALVVLVLVGACSMMLLGLFYDHTHPQHFRVTPPEGRDYVVMSALGTFAALLLLSQKNSLLLSFARQSILSELSGSGWALALSVALGSGVALAAQWIVAAYCLKDEQINFWFSDVVSLGSWLSLYFLLDVVRPFMFMWHVAFITVVLLLCGGVYFWSSARLEVDYIHLKENPMEGRIHSLNHMVAGFRFFNVRVLLKRLIAVISFMLIVPFLGKTYLHYYRLTMRQAVIQAIKSL